MQELTIFLMCLFIFEVPFRIIVPLFGSSFASLLVPDNGHMRMKEVLAMSLRPHCNRNFFSMEILFRIMWNFFTKLAECKGKVSTLKSSTDRPFQIGPLGYCFRQKKDASFRCKLVKRHSPGLLYAAFRVILRILRRRLRSQ